MENDRVNVPKKCTGFIFDWKDNILNIEGKETFYFALKRDEIVFWGKICKWKCDEV